MKHDPDKHADKKPQSYFARAFGNAARRKFTTALLGAALISGCATFESTSPAAARTPPATDTIAQTENVIGMAPPLRTDLSEKEISRRALIRDLLLIDAQRRYPELAEKSGTAYSRELSTLQKQLNEYLKHSDTTVHNVVVIMDPAKIDVAVALGLPLSLVIQHEVRKYDKEAGTGPARSAAPHAVRTFRPASGVTTYTQNPSAFPNMTSEKAEPCLILPASDHAFPFTIDGMTHAQKIEFANIHEGWHCLDTRYRMTQAQMDALNKGDVTDMEEIILSADLTVAISVMHHKETVADVAALGDMVRRGHSPDIIDKAIAWRQQGVQSDYIHYSVPALVALKGEIDAMGVEAFRKLPLEKASETYFNITDAHALTPSRLQAMALYLSGGPQIRDVLNGAAAQSSDITKGIAYAEQIMKPGAPQQPMRDIIAAFAPPDMALRQALLDWKPLDKLEQTAFAQGGKITPETLITAYSSMQSQLHSELTGEDPRLAREKMSLLKAIFTRYLRTADYIAVNDKFGVDIEVAEKERLDRVRTALMAPQTHTANNAPAPANNSGTAAPQQTNPQPAAPPATGNGQPQTSSRISAPRHS